MYYALFQFIRELVELPHWFAFHVMVQDAGCGMDAKTLAHVFEPFFTTKAPEKGTGLGLATVYGVVKQSRGYIDVASEPGRGSRFTVYLPRVGQPIAESGTPQTGQSPSAPQDTILVVEDEESIRKLITTILQDQGYHVLAAGDGIEALQSLQMLKGKCPDDIGNDEGPRMPTTLIEKAHEMLQMASPR